MTAPDIKQITKARATGRVYTDYCPECGEYAQFEFSDSTKTFTIGLSALIKMILATDTDDDLAEWRHELREKYMLLQEDLWLHSNLKQGGRRTHST